MVQWPCILKLEGDSELIFLASEQALSSELDGLIFSSSDCLIDGLGQTYQVKSCRFGYTLESQDRMLSLDCVTELIQEHQFAQAENWGALLALLIHKHSNNVNLVKQ